jgi:transposase
MSRFFAYDPNPGHLLPPNVKDVLGVEHLCFRLHAMVEELDVRQFERAYGPEGRLAYPPRMMLKVWLYAFCLGVSSTRRLERRVREDLAFRYLAGGRAPDHKTLSEFLRRHRRAINDVFTQVVQMARRAGLGKLGQVWRWTRRECGRTPRGAAWWTGNRRDASSGHGIGGWCGRSSRRRARKIRRKTAA